MTNITFPELALALLMFAFLLTTCEPFSQFMYAVLGVRP